MISQDIIIACHNFFYFFFPMVSPVRIFHRDREMIEMLPKAVSQARAYYWLKSSFMNNLRLPFRLATLFRFRRHSSFKKPRPFYTSYTFFFFSERAWKSLTGWLVDSFRASINGRTFSTKRNHQQTHKAPSREHILFIPSPTMSVRCSRHSIIGEARIASLLCGVRADTAN